MSRARNILAANRERNRDERLIGDPFISMNFLAGAATCTVNGTNTDFDDICIEDLDWGTKIVGSFGAEGLDSCQGVLPAALAAELGTDLSMVAQFSITDLPTASLVLEVHDDPGYNVANYASIAAGGDLELFFNNTGATSTPGLEEAQMYTLAVTFTPGQIQACIGGGSVSRLIVPPLSASINQVAWFWENVSLQRLELFKLPFSELQLRRISTHIIS